MAIDRSAPLTPRGQSPQLWAGLRATLDNLGVDSPSILDCGGGSGSLAVPLAAAGASVTVVDVSIDALSTLARRAAEAGAASRVTPLQGEIESLSDVVGSQSFDVVLAHEVLASVANLSDAFEQLVSALKPGGALSVVIGNPVAIVLSRALAGDVSAALALVNQSPGVAGFEIERACIGAGLVVESVRGIGVFSELIPGIELERPGAAEALDELEELTTGLAPYRDIASRVHVIARKPALSG